jgi:hypothetical protein
MNRKAIASELVKLAKELVAEVSLFDETNVDEIAAKVKSELGKAAPFVNVRKSTLGGPAHLTLMLTISIDPREKWSNGILENSRYCHMSIERGGEIEYFSGHGMGKFRKSRVADIDAAIRKISDFIRKAGEQKTAAFTGMSKTVRKMFETSIEMFAKEAQEFGYGVEIMGATVAGVRMFLWRGERYTTQSEVMITIGSRSDDEWFVHLTGMFDGRNARSIREKRSRPTPVDAKAALDVAVQEAGIPMK